MEGSDDLLKSIRTDSDYDRYQPFVDIEWARNLATQLESTPLRTPFAELALAFRQAESLHITPRQVVEVSSRHLDGYLKSSANWDIRVTEMTKAMFLNGAGRDLRLTMRKKVLADIESALATILGCNPSVQEMQEILWNELFSQWEFAMTIWHSQSMAYCSLVFGYEWFVVSAYRILSDGDDSDPQGRNDRFWKTLAARFGYEGTFSDYWDNDQVWLARTVRNKFAHTGGRYVRRKNDRDITNIEPRPVMNNGYFSIQPQDTVRLYSLLKDKVSSFVARAKSVLSKKEG